LRHYPDLVILHAAGRQNEVEMRRVYQMLLKPAEQARVVVKGFVNDLYRYSGAADVVVTRAGATHLAEFAVQAKACIIVPNPNLTGGHQLKNAQSLAERGAALVLPENELIPPSERLAAACSQLLTNNHQRHQLADNLAALAHPRAAHELAQLLLKTCRPKNRVK
jgi:UDP-N-acetylglucosamine--N-acetylmuramyl-(pentapeptide) pyrophosphoryl-undecaprenol N-acetylglucosamine transferase